MPKLETSLGNLVRRASRGISRDLESRIEKHGISIGMWYFLRVLWEEDGLTQGELSDRLGVMGPTTVSALERMERSGLVDRVRSEDDKRRVIVTLTSKGRALKAKMAPIARAVVVDAARGLSEPEILELKRMLAIVVRNVDEAPE